MPKPNDLWGADFEANPVEAEPVTLLKQQADLLTERTGGRLVGIVRDHLDSDGKVWTSLIIRVPALREFEHKLISIEYPVTAANSAFPRPLVAWNDHEDGPEEIEGMNHFRTWLEATLSSPEIHAVLGNLLRYAPAMQSA